VANTELQSASKHTFSPIDVPGASVTVTETDNGGIDMSKDAVFAFHEEIVRSDNLVLQSLSSFKGIFLGVAVADRIISNGNPQMYAYIGAYCLPSVPATNCVPAWIIIVSCTMN
jgi:hypothetical protein